MKDILACRIFERELEKLGEPGSIRYFEPMCHRLREPEFAKYVASLLDAEGALLCGDCGGLSRVATSKGIRIPPYDDCVDILLPGIERDPGTLYLTDGWIDHFDEIFGLDRLPPKARDSAMGVLFSSISKIAYVSTPASAKEGDAERLAEGLGCDFVSLLGSLSNVARFLEELRE